MPRSMRQQLRAGLWVVLAFLWQVEALDVGAQEPQDGFPVPFSSTTTGLGHAHVGDVDGDSLPEIVVGTHGLGMYVYRGDGTILPGWPYSIGGGITAPPVVGDIDGDGIKEVVFTQYVAPVPTIHAVSATGEPKPGWPVTAQGAGPLHHLALGDLDGDGALEVLTLKKVVQTLVYAWTGSGDPAPGWPVAVPDYVSAAGLAVGDIDFDGSSEVVIPTWGPVYVYNSDGTIRAGWPVSVGGILGAPVVADLDGDFSCEIIGGFENSVFVLNSEGSLEAQYSVAGLNSLISCADLDGDGDLEIVAPAQQLWILGNGPPISTDIAEYTTFKGATIGDVDGDGSQEIAAWSLNFQGSPEPALHLFNADLEDLAGWPLTGGFNSLYWYTAMGDLDADNDIEIVYANDTELVAWDVPNTIGGPARVEWATRGHDITHSRFFHQGAIPVPHYLRGDASRDAVLDIADPVMLLMVLFMNEETDCFAQLDFDADASVTTLDAIGLLLYLFLDSPPPTQEPYPVCGPAPEDDQLPCNVASCP